VFFLWIQNLNEVGGVLTATSCLKMDRELELMICMKEQGYTTTLNGKTISFPIEVMLDMWDILNEERRG